MYLCILQPRVQNAPFHRGEGKIMMLLMMMMMMMMMMRRRMMMMCVCVDIACVFYTSSWYVACVREGDQPYGEPPPSLSATHTHIYIYVCVREGQTGQGLGAKGASSHAAGEPMGEETARS